ncbi:MAG: divergent PAP2 family protein [Bulleidia sp.]|nr:divergent PAP2 family protein [Bulleidia sp.]
MFTNMYPFFSAVSAALIAQLVKPLCYWVRYHKWVWHLAKESGGFPSSHSAMVTAMALSVGLQEHFSSTLFAVSFTMAVIVIYDAANVRYYSGQNIKVTQQLVKDVQENLHTTFLSPIYQIKLKNVLGHKWVEVFGGIVLGALVALLFHFGAH